MRESDRRLRPLGVFWAAATAFRRRDHRHNESRSKEKTGFQNSMNIDMTSYLS
jgi:hypothetical protein